MSGIKEEIKKQALVSGYDVKSSESSIKEAIKKEGKIKYTPEESNVLTSDYFRRQSSNSKTSILSDDQFKSLSQGIEYDEVNKYLDRPFNPLTENVTYLTAANQSVGAKIGGFANQLQGEIIGGAIEGFGYLGDVAHWGNRLSGGEGDWGNWLSDIGTSYKDLTRDLTPIYQRNPNEGFDPGDFGWWMSNAVSVGSSLSLLIPAAGAVSLLGKLGKVTGMLDKAVKLGSKLGLAAESTKMLGTVMGRAMFSRHMENMMEAHGTFDEIYNKQKQLGKSDEEATRLASGGAADVYRNNWPLVIQDIAQMALIAKGPNFTKAVDSAAVATAAGMSAKGALLKAGYTKGWDMLTEGAEEAYQFVVGEEAKYSVDVATGLKPKSNFGDRLGEYAKDGHLWTSALFGALGAGVMQAAGPLVNKLTSGEYNPETAARVEEIKTRGVTYAAASKLYREAANADSKEGIEHASDFMALDLVTRAEATGNLDLQFKQLDDFKTMSKEERAAENFDEGMVERIDDIKSRMQEIVEMSKNIRKTHDPLVRYNVAMRMLQNKRFNKTLQESKVNESVNTNAIPRHADLSSFGKSSLNDILDLNAVNSAIAATSQMLQGNITDFAKSKLEQTLKDYEAKRDAIAAKLNSKEANTNITEEDRKIIDSYQNSPFVDKVIVDKVKTIIAKDAIDRNNEEIAHLGSKEGIEDYKRVVAKARKKQADKDAKDAQDKLDADNAAADELVKAKSKEEELGKLTTELTPSDEELLKSMPEGHLIGKTDAELQAIADKDGLQLSDVKVWQQADIEAFNKLKEQAANTAKTKAQEKLAEASKTNDEFIPTADNTTQIDFTESLPERESPKITTGHALAWKSSGNALSSELDKFNNKELSNFLEDPNIDLSAYDVVFSIDQDKLRLESKYEGVADQLAAGNFENIGEVPVKGVFHLNGVPVLSPSGKPYTVYIHDSTYEYFAEQHREDAIAEAIALKTAVVAAKPGTTISTKIVNKSKGHLNVDKQGNKFIFHSLAESINDKSDKLEFAIGGNGGIYLNTAENKDIHNSLVGLLSARPGAVYTLVKTANGKVVPIRTWVSKLDEQEATLLYNTYKDILNKPQEYQNKLSKEFKEANASILTSLPINTATITYKELLEFFVFEGALTKDMGGRQLYTTKDGTLHIAGEVIDIQTMNTPEGMTKFVNLITAGNFRQISRTKLADNSYKAYVSKNNILTTNVVKVNNNIFVQPTLTIGKLESKSAPAEQQAEVVSDSNTQTRTSEDFNNPNESYRVIVGEESFNDIVESGVVRVKDPSDKVAKGKQGGINLDRRGTTAYPSFSKGSASMQYAGENPNNYIIVTEDQSIQPSKSGRHGKGTTMFPTDVDGKHLETLDGSKVDVYKHVGNGKYELVYTKGKLVEQKQTATNQQAEVVSDAKADIERRRPTSYINNSKDKKSPLETFRNEAKREWDGISVITGDRMQNLYTGIQLFVEAYPEHKELLDKFIKKESGGFGITNNNLSFVLNTLKKQGVTTESELGNKINAKYDAELEATQSTQAGSVAGGDKIKLDPDLANIDPILIAARNGDVAAQKQFEEMGLDWKQTTTYRFVGQSEVDVLLSNEKVESKRGMADAGIDVTSSPKVTTAATGEYRVTFKESFDKNNGLGKVRKKNEEDSNLERGRGYDINDVAKIERIDERGNVVETIYEQSLKETTKASSVGVEGDVKLTGEQVKNKLQEIEKQPVKINITQDANGKMEQTSQEVIDNIKAELDKTGLPYSDVVSNDKGSTYFVVTKDGQQHEILKVLQSGGKLVPTNLTKAKWINHLIKTEKDAVVKAVEQSLKETPQQSTEDVRSKIEELKAKLARARSIKSKVKIQEELDALTITEAVEPVTQPVVKPVETVTRDFADSLFPEVTNLNDNQITKSKMRILWNANKDIIIKKWGVESFDKFYNLAKLDPKVTEWTINNCK